MESLLQDRFFILLAAGLFGAVFGSFATALIYRLPREINWVSKRSICPKCDHALGVLDLFPIFSYLFTMGHCRHCKAKFGANYLFIELLMVISFVLSAYLFGPTVKTVVISMLSFATIIIFVVDFEHYIIPDEINILIGLLGIAYGLNNGEGVEQLVYMPLFYFGLAMFLRWFMFVWKKKEGLGLGDVKFFLAAGTFLSVEALPNFLFISGFVGIIIAILWRLLKKGEIFPFGPALSLSLLFCVAFPESNAKLIMLFQEVMI
jgi:prepilin signal peptidase PulO-like enzyme (type II secretory pathway)